MKQQHFDVLIIGAGVSGIGLGCHLTQKCPLKTFAILERRQAMGGTWDLFRYPGIRSDSDMFTFGYEFKPWISAQTLADGPAIKAYVQEAAAEYGVDRKIRYGRKVLAANWADKERRWTVRVLREDNGQTEEYSCDFLLGCTGYYNYDAGYRPVFPGEETFKGTVVHPQHWPEDLDYRDKKVVVIGSGATAVTLIPAMAKDTAQITMLQRSPTYIYSLPAIDPISANLQKTLPARTAYRLARLRNIGFQRVTYSLARQRPEFIRRRILDDARRRLNGKVSMRHFTPSYDPWDQRICAVPDGDLFNVLRRGKASIVTDHIASFTESGIRLQSGAELQADIIVTATGLNVQMLGGAELTVNEKPVPISDRVTYKSLMLEGVPNAAIIFGYVNASWTLKVDIAAHYLCRLLNHMDAKGYRKVVADGGQAHATEACVFGALNAGYVQRAAAEMPRQGESGPWRVSQDYVRDIPLLRYAPIEDDCLRFDDGPAANAAGWAAQISGGLRTALGRS